MGHEVLFAVIVCFVLNRIYASIVIFSVFEIREIFFFLGDLYDKDLGFLDRNVHLALSNSKGLCFHPGCFRIF